MAWKVIGCMEGRDKVGKLPPIYGPLPVKVWVKRPGEKRPRVKAAKMGGTRGIFDKSDLERKAVEYARWLAARDGVTLPDGHTESRFLPVTVPGRKSPEQRVYAVAFHHPAPPYRPTPRGVQRYPSPPVVIEIPNWDWIPRDPVETIDPLPARDEMDSMFEAGFRAALQRDGYMVPVLGDGFQMVA